MGSSRIKTSWRVIGRILEKALREDGDAGSSDDEYQDLDESEDEEQEEEIGQIRVGVRLGV